MGPSGQLLQRMAKKWDMHVVGTFYAWGTEPNSSDLAYNSGAEPLRLAFDASKGRWIFGS